MRSPPVGVALVLAGIGTHGTQCLIIAAALIAVAWKLAGAPGGRATAVIGH